MAKTITLVSMYDGTSTLASNVYCQVYTHLDGIYSRSLVGK
jgi:hypothetical protein